MAVMCHAYCVLGIGQKASFLKAECDYGAAAPQALPVLNSQSLQHAIVEWHRWENRRGILQVQHAIAEWHVWE